MKIRWLDRRIACPGPYLTLVLSQEEFNATLRHCKVSAWQPYLSSPRADATSHHLVNGSKELVTIVALGDMTGRSGVEIAGLLVHEATHIWQEYCESIGETNPGREQEAYAIQAIAQELMAEYSWRICHVT